MKGNNDYAGGTFFLKLIALIAIIGVFLKGIIDVDSNPNNVLSSWDSWNYHLPFAARIWGIVPPEMYLFESHEEYRFDGFPLLVEFLQGFFWFITQRLQAANLVGFVFLVLYGGFLRSYFQVPLYLSAIAFLAVPLIQIHVTSCYVDLPGNICMSILILLTYLLYVNKNANNWRNLLFIVLAAAGAVNTKLSFVPLVLLVLIFVLARVVWLRWQTGEINHKWLLSSIPLIFLATLLIFATPIKNVVFYGNPFYPVKIEIAGIVLNHKLGFYQAAPGYLENVPKAVRWLFSILEINSANWSVDQWSNNPDQLRMGGFFGTYVVFNLFLFAYLLIQQWKQQQVKTRIALIVFSIMSIVTAFNPQSHELRYYMYWIISLISLNLILVITLEQLPENYSLITPKTMGLICLIFLTIVVVKTNYFYIKPSMYSLREYIHKTVDFGVLAGISPGDKVCVGKKQPHTFLYASKFHPYLDYDYLIKAAANRSECEGYEKTF
jgi:hypothetical protein